MARTPGTYAVFNTTEGNIVCRLFETDAPKTVANFVELAEGTREWTHPTTRKKGKEPLYNGTIFHRVIPDFMIQGGCPEGSGTGSNGNTRLKAEFNNRPDRKHARGVLSMARSSDPNSASCQFFIVHKDSTHLDGKYSAFGIVTSGIETVDKIAAMPTGANDRPKNPPKIVKITVQE